MYLSASKSGADLNAIISSSPVELPRIYESLETNSLANDYLSPSAFQAYVLCTDNMRFFVKTSNSLSTTIEQKSKVLEKYVKYLGLAKNVNELEVKRLKGDLSEADEEIQLQKLINEINKK
jgi:hypothetical protein